MAPSSGSTVGSSSAAVWSASRSGSVPPPRTGSGTSITVSARSPPSTGASRTRCNRCLRTPVSSLSGFHTFAGMTRVLNAALTALGHPHRVLAGDGVFGGGDRLAKRFLSRRTLDLRAQEGQFVGGQAVALAELVV